MLLIPATTCGHHTRRCNVVCPTYHEVTDAVDVVLKMLGAGLTAVLKKAGYGIVATV